VAYDLSSPLPVQLPKRITPDETPEDYDTMITQNTDNINQNFTEHNLAIQDLLARLKKLEEG
jgi:hypothetical protein